MKKTRIFLTSTLIFLTIILSSCQTQIRKYTLPEIPERPKLEEVETTDDLKVNFEKITKYSLKLESWAFNVKELVEK